MSLRTGIFIYIVLLLSGCEIYTSISPTVTPIPAPTIQSFAHLGKGSIRMFAWSPDGHELAVATSLGIRILNAQSLEETGFIDTKAGVQTISYSPNGEFIASVDNYSRIFLWNATTKQLAKEVVGIQALDGVSSIAFSPDGVWLIVITYRKLYLLEVETEEVAYMWDFFTNSVAFSLDGQLIAAAGSNEEGQVIRVWEIASGRAIHTFDNGVMDTVRSLTFSPDSKAVIGGSNSYTRYWDVTSGKELETRVVSPLRLVTAMSVDPQGNRLALSDDCGRVRLDNLPYGPETILRKECPTIYSRNHILAFSPEGKTLALGPDDNTIKFWEVENGQQSEVLNGNQHVYYAPVFNSDGDKLQVVDGDRNPFEWDWTTEQLSPFTGGGDNCFVFSTDQRFCAQKTISDDKLIEVRDRLTHQKIFSFESKKGVRAIAVSMDGKKLAVGEGSLINLWDINREQLIHILEGHTDGVWGVAFNQDGSLVASVGGGHENTVRIWNTATGDLVRAVPGTSPIAFTAEGFLLAGYLRVETGEMRLWSLEQEKPLWIFQEYELTTAVAIKPGSSILAISSASYDGSTIQLWDIMRREHLYNLTGSEGVSRLVFSPNGHTLAANSIDGTIYLWDVSFVQ